MTIDETELDICDYYGGKLGCLLLLLIWHREDRGCHYLISSEALGTKKIGICSGDQYIGLDRCIDLNGGDTDAYSYLDNSVRVVQRRNS